MARMYLLPKLGYAGISKAHYWEAVIMGKLGQWIVKTSKDSLLVVKFFDGPDT